MSRRDELKTEILRHILLHHKSTRPELVALTGGRAATVFEAIDELKAEGILTEPERRGKKTGRRAPELRCGAECCRTVGVELRTNGCCGVIADASGKVLHSLSLNSPEIRRSLADSRREILTLLQKLRDLAGDEWDTIRGIGFADPGLVDIAKGRSIRAVNIPGWEKLDTAGWLNKVSGLPSGVWPEEMIKTRMEYFSRLARPPKSLFHLGTGDGIGGGFICNGELFVGSTSRAMEIGHVVVDPQGPECSCGNRGCLETMVSCAAIARQVAQMRAKGVDIPLDTERFSMAEFCACVPRNKGVRIIADTVCRHIGCALSMAVALLNPELIVISGPLTALGELLTDAVRRELELRCFPEAVKELKIELSASDEFGTVRGAALMMRDRLLVGGI